MIGQELGGRYEILERIGGGGMALVYKGHDLLLHRKVAIKVLRQQFVHDDEFIRRFRREAQSAASLSHPNVVSIYDVGQEEDVHYIVMEYVEGSTLNELIKEKAPLQVEDAIHIASQICDALDHAHSNQIIHRDIKPHNILIGKNGRVKVTDFGIARAATSSTITQTGSVVGSVHYFSPEHAKGTMAGAKSDLYSLGIVLYQMLTGRLPFLGESPISVALKHLQEDVEDPRKVNPLIPQSVENIILKAVRKNPEERYQSAKDMLSDLETCLLPERRNEPRLTFAAAEDDDDEEQTRVVPAIRADQTTAATSGKDSSAPVQSKAKPWVKPLVWGCLLAITALVMWFGVNRALDKLSPPDVKIPDVENKTITDAKVTLTNAGLKYDILQEFNDKVDKDLVIRQSPSGMSVKMGSIIHLWVSKGVEQQIMADYHGKLFKDVKSQLMAAGIREDQITMEEDYFKDEPKDTIVQQTPKANEAYDPTKVAFKFTVSKGREMISMPDLVGSTLAEAEATLRKNNLTLKKPDNVIYQPSFAAKGKVFKQWPYQKGDDVEAGADNIIIYISSGPPEDAGQMTVSLLLTPAKDGKSSVFRLVVSDAQYDNYDYTTVEASKQQPQNVSVTVTKDKNAVVQIFRDNVLFDSKTYTYADYLKQKNNPAPSPSAAASPGPSAGSSAGPSVKPSPTPSPAAGGR